MKTALVLSSVLLAMLTSAQIPKNVVKEFERIHPGARYVEWKTEWGLLEDQYRVTYTNWFRQTLVFNRDAQILISESELPPDYIPGDIHAFVKKYYPHAKYVVWDTFDENNQRSYFVICNEKQKLVFTNTCEFKGEVSLSKPKRSNLLSFFDSGKK